MKTYFFLLLFLFANTSWGQKNVFQYEVIFKNKSIGKVTATLKSSGAKSIKDISTLTDAKILLMSVHVESEINVVYQKGVMLKGVAYRHANRGNSDVHSTVTMVGDSNYKIERNGKIEQLNSNITFCVADLFFQEPKGISTIFSNMYAKQLSVKETTNGRYVVATPDNKNSYYTYKNGKLVLVESDTPLGKVISKLI